MRGSKRCYRGGCQVRPLTLSFDAISVAMSAVLLLTLLLLLLQEIAAVFAATFFPDPVGISSREKKSEDFARCALGSSSIFYR